MKDLIQEGRKIQETFKKNVNESPNNIPGGSTHGLPVELVNKLAKIIEPFEEEMNDQVFKYADDYGDINDMSKVRQILGRYQTKVKPKVSTLLQKLVGQTYKGNVIRKAELVTKLLDHEAAGQLDVVVTFENGRKASVYLGY